MNSTASLAGREGSKSPRAHARRAPVPAIHRVVTHLARRLNQVCLGISAEVTLSEDLTPQEFGMLLTVDEMPGVDQRTLAGLLATDPMTVTQCIDKLETMGLITRNADPKDRRVRRLTATDDGYETRRRVRPLLEAGHRRIPEPLTKSERSTFIDMLVRIVEGNADYARPGLARRRPKRLLTTDARPGRLLQR
jgi:DNA-binding MarR family transcriptional regulator